MSRYQRTRRRDWLFCFAFLVVGLFFLCVAEFARRNGTTPESELTVVTGRATDASASSFKGVDYLRFTVQDQTVDYSSGMPGFDKVANAIRRGTPMTIGVSTKRETLFPRNGWVALYTLAIQGKPVLTYQDTITIGYRGSNAAFILAGVLLLISSWGLWTCFRNRNPNAEPLTPAELATAWNDPKKVRTAAIVLSVAIYGAVMFAMLHEDSMPTSIKVFGEKPLGLPLRVFIGVFFSVLMIPLPFAAWHGYRILFRHASEGGSLGQVAMVRSLFTATKIHPELKRSQVIVLAIITFYLALMFGWAFYADSRGI